jgi:Arc/MetJ-type ribon-helix-helix transcriptional regulator
LELVSSEGQAKKSTARFLALGVNGVGVALMMVVFSQTAGISGAEFGLAGGTAVLAQRVLEAVFGEDAVRRLAKRAKLELDARIEVLLASELDRFFRALDQTGARPEQAELIRAAVVVLNQARARETRLTAPARAELTGARSAVEAVPRRAELTGGVSALEAYEIAEGER